MNETVKIVNILLENKSDKNHKNIFGQNILHIMCSFNNVKLIEILLNDKSQESKDLMDGTTTKETQNPFHYACRYNSYEAVKFLSNVYISEKKMFLEAKDYQGRTPFYLAAEHG